MPGSISVTSELNERPFGSRLHRQLFLFLIFFAAASASLNGFYDKWNSIIAPIDHQHTTARIDSMLDGTLSRPYVYRRLLPDVANLAARVLPLPWQNWLVAPHALGPTRMSFSLVPTMVGYEDYAFRFLVVYLTAFLFAVLALYAMYLICSQLSFPPLVAILAPVLILVLVPYTMNMGGYFYDYSELAFFALAAWVALRFDWWWLLPVGAMATWNKESFLLFVPTLYPMLRQRSSRIGASMGIGLIEISGGIVYLVIRARFAHNPGSAFQVHWRQQARFFTDVQNLFFATDKTYGIVILSAATVLPMALLAWTIWRSWGRVPVVIRKHALIAAAINSPLFLLFCAPGELRDFSLLYIALLVVLAATLTMWASSPANSISAD